MSSQLTNHLLTMHHSLRQRENAKGGGKIFDKVQPTLSIHYGVTNKVVGSAELIEMVRSIFRTYDLNYQHVAGKPPAWLGVISPYFTFMSGFNLRMEELRMGCGEMTIAKAAEGKSHKDVAIPTRDSTPYPPGRHQLPTVCALMK